MDEGFFFRNFACLFLIRLSYSHCPIVYFLSKLNEVNTHLQMCTAVPERIKVLPIFLYLLVYHRGFFYLSEIRILIFSCS